MKVSVVVATYRRDDSLKSAVESLLNQTYKDVEIIIVDDNADKEWNFKVNMLVSEFQDKNIVYIQNKKIKVQLKQEILV